MRYDVGVDYIGLEDGGVGEAGETLDALADGGAFLVGSHLDHGLHGENLLYGNI